MALRNTVTGWGWLARLLHWSMAIVILGLLVMGFYIAQILTGTDSDTLLAKFNLTQDHKSWGFVAFSLALLRVIWRAVNPAPALPDGMKRIERVLAHAGHWGLYVCMFAMPITGWLMASASPLQDAYGIKNKVFGLFEMPDPFVPGSQELVDLFATMHAITAISLVVLLLGHIAAALKHHFVNRDTVLRRMIRG
ncbi:MAG: cytochrome b [Pseudomonadota bacterium]